MQKNRKELVKNITLTGVMASLYVVFVILFGDLSFGFSGFISFRVAEILIPLLSKFSSKRDALTDELTLFSLAVRDLIVLKKSDMTSLEFYCDSNEAIELSDKVSLSYLYSLYQNIDIACEENSRNANVKILIMKLAINSKIL